MVDSNSANGAVVTHVGVVYPWHCDHNGHMNVMWFVSKFDEATWCLMHHAGITSSYLRRERRGMVAVEQKLAYRHELFAGDVLQIESRVLEAREKVIRLVHTMVAIEHGVAATCELTGVQLDLASRKSVPFPPDLLERVRALAID